MANDYNIRDRLEEALSEIKNETGYVIKRLNIDWIDTSTPDGRDRMVTGMKIEADLI